MKSVTESRSITANSAREELRSQVQRLIARIQRRQDLCKKFHALSLQQPPLIKSGNFNALYEIVSAKDRLINEYSADLPSTSSLQHEFQTLKPHLDARTLAVIDTLLEDLQQSIRVTIELDEQCRAQLVSRHAETEHELKQVQQSRKAHDHYRNTAEPQPRARIDTRS